MFIMGDLSVSLSILFLHFVKMRNRSAAIRAGNRRMEWDGGAVGQGDRFGVPRESWWDGRTGAVSQSGGTRHVTSPGTEKNKEGYDLQGRGNVIFLSQGLGIRPKNR